MRTIVVTGSATGIGAATTALLRERGNRVITVDVVPGADVTADLGTPEGREHGVAAVRDLVEGSLDGVATFAGIPSRSWNPPPAVVSVNYFGTVAVLDGLRDLLAVGHDASAVVTSSNSVTTTPNVDLALVDALLAGDEDEARAVAGAAPHYAAYPSSKLALARWVRRHAVTAGWIGSGITLNAIAPGHVDTPLSRSARDDETLAPLLEAFPRPIGRPGRPEEIASVAAFLLGPEARLFCGSVLFVDGGSDAALRPDDWPAPMPRA